MNVKKHCSAGKALVVVVIALSAALMALLTLRSSVAAQDATPPPALDGDTLLVRSFPAGLPVYVVPADLANGAMGDIYVTSPDYLRGNTPLEIPLEPGDYRVTITNYDHPFEFWEDGETNIMFVLGLDEDGQTMSSVTPAGKSYSVTKDAGKQTIVTSLFWPKDQSLEDFVASIPDQPLFEISYEEFFQTKFQDHRIPPGIGHFCYPCWAELASWCGTRPTRRSSVHLFYRAGRDHHYARSAAGTPNAHPAVRACS